MKKTLEQMQAFVRKTYPDVKCEELANTKNKFWVHCSGGGLGRGPTLERAWWVAFKNTETVVALRGRDYASGERF